MHGQAYGGPGISIRQHCQCQWVCWSYLDSISLREWKKARRGKQVRHVSSCCTAGGGVYYKGTVTKVRQQMPAGGINLQGRQDYDPWEALEVEWDVGGDAEGMDHISPWEIEVCLVSHALP